MALVPSVTELLVAEMLYLQYDDPRKPIYLYINSAGVVGGKRGSRLGYETEALSIYDTMAHVKPPVRTLCVGTAYGEAAMLLAAGEKGTRAALPSASIMLRQPMQRYAQMQASDVDIYRKEMRKTKNKLVRWGGGAGGGGQHTHTHTKNAHTPPPPLSFPPTQFELLAKHTGQTLDDLEEDLVRPKYLNPYEAIKYGVIDRVLTDDDAATREMVKAATWNTDRA